MASRNLEKDDLVKVAVETVSEAGLLKKRAIRGVAFLGIRRIVVQIILTGSNIILARLLFPRIFGAFAVASTLVGLLGVFFSPGLGAALTQRKREPTKEELQASFTVNLVLGLMMVALIVLLAPIFWRFYSEQLGDQGILYIQLLAISLVGARLRSMSLVKLQRELDYGRIIIGEILELSIMQAVSVFLAMKGLGVLSLVWGFVLSRFLGTLILFILAPWPIGLRLSFSAIQNILPFGVDFQISQIVGAVNGAVTPVFVGKVSGSTSVGLLNWASGVATLPRAVPEILGRMVFPVCARTQDNKWLLKVVIEKSIQFSCLAAFPLMIILAVLAHPLTYIVYTYKWLAGVPALYLFSIQSIFIIIGVVLMQALLALGEARAFRNISIFWAGLQWILTVPLVFEFGFIGLPIAGVIVSSTFFIPLVLLRRKVKFEIGRHVWPYLVFSLVVGLIVFLINQHWPAQRILDLVINAGFGGLIYLILIFAFKRREIIEDIVKVKRILF